MIDRHKIRAARALINWTQPQLAERAGLSKNSIAHIEIGMKQPSTRTVAKIERAFKAEGIVFTPNGLERQKDTVIWLDGYPALMDSVLDVKPDEVLFMNADDRKSSDDVMAKVLQMEAAGIKRRFLSPPDCTTFLMPSSEYRISNMVAARDVTVIYANRMGFYTPSGVMLIINDYLAEDYRKQFEVLWDHGQDV